MGIASLPKASFLGKSSQQFVPGPSDRCRSILATCRRSIKRSMALAVPRNWRPGALQQRWVSTTTSTLFTDQNHFKQYLPSSLRESILGQCILWSKAGEESQPSLWTWVMSSHYGQCDHTALSVRSYPNYLRPLNAQTPLPKVVYKSTGFYYIFPTLRTITRLLGVPIFFWRCPHRIPSVQAHPSKNSSGSILECGPGISTPTEYIYKSMAIERIWYQHCHYST